VRAQYLAIHRKSPRGLDRRIRGGNDGPVWRAQAGPGIGQPLEGRILHARSGPDDEEVKGAPRSRFASPPASASAKPAREEPAAYALPPAI